MSKMKRKAPRGMSGMGAAPKAGKNDMMRQFQKLQEEMAQSQEKLLETEVEGSAGGGAVTVTATASKTLTAVHINPDVIDEDDIEMLEDLVLAAVNDAMSKADQITNSEMSKFTGGMNIPGLM